jgi:hypothetical protein
MGEPASINRQGAVSGEKETANGRMARDLSNNYKAGSQDYHGAIPDAICVDEKFPLAGISVAAAGLGIKYINYVARCAAKPAISTSSKLICTLRNSRENYKSYKRVANSSLM